VAYRGSEGPVDNKAWLGTVGYPTDPSVVDLEVVAETLGVLELVGVVRKPDSGEYIL